MKSIFERRSIRKYKDIDVTDEQIKALLEAAMAAPSAKAQDPWEFYVVKNKEKQVEIRSQFPQWDKNSALLIVPCVNVSKTLSGTINDYAIEDVSAAIENMLIEATSLGLGSLWCGAFPKEERYSKLQELLGLDSSIVPIALLHFGVSDEEKEERTRFDSSKVHYID